MSLLKSAWTIVVALFSSQPKFSVSLPGDLRFDGKTILITGATSGLGLEAAVLFARLGASSIIITARTASKGAAAKTIIEQRTGRPDIVQVRILDMDTFASILSFINSLKQEVFAIDSIILNAGIHNVSYVPSEEGWELDLQVNVLSTALLGLLLMPWMRIVKKEGREQHLVFVGSGSHFGGWDIGDGKWPAKDVLKSLNERKNYESGFKQYGGSKLLLQYVANEIADLAVDDDERPSPIVNTVCPGLIKTNITRDYSKKNLFTAFFAWVFMLRGYPVEVGGKSLVLATTTTKEQHGSFRRPYITDEEYAEASEKNISSPEGQRLRAQVWKEVIGVLKEVSPAVESIVNL